MARDIKPKVRNFIKWAQKGHCLLCTYPFRLHLHHVISVDDDGPDHYLNLVALCPNHHFLVETIKREIAPRNSSFKKGLVAIKFRDKLEQDKQEILDILSKPYEFSNVDITDEDIDLIKYLANDVKEEVARLLDMINKFRPRIFLCPPWQSTINQKDKNILYSLDLFDKKELQNKIDIQAEEKMEKNGFEIYAEVITEHLRNMGIPFVALPSESK